jgi:transcriptional regulator with XRE-family HTH domain
MQADGRCGVPDPQAGGNQALRAARKAHGWSQEEFAERFEAAARELGLGLSLSVRQVRRWECSSPPWPHPPYRKVLQHLYLRPVEELGFSRPYEQVLLDKTQVQPRTLESDSGSEEDEVLLREFLHVAGLGTLSANRIGFALLAPSSIVPSGPPPSVKLLARHVADVKTMFQACEYAKLDALLPEKLAAATVAIEAAESDDARSFALSAHVDLLHVASGLLLKQGTPRARFDRRRPSLQGC